MHGFAHLKLQFPFWLPLSDRDLVIEGRGVDMLERDTVMVVIRNYEGDGTCALPPLENKVTRIALSGGYHIVPVSPQR